MSDCNHCDPDVGFLCDMCARDEYISKLEDTIRSLCSEFSSVRVNNTRDWMDFAVERINAAVEVIRETDRCTTDGRIIRWVKSK